MTKFFIKQAQKCNFELVSFFKKKIKILDKNGK